MLLVLSRRESTFRVYRVEKLNTEEVTMELGLEGRWGWGWGLETNPMKADLGISHSGNSNLPRVTLRIINFAFGKA